MTVQLKSFTTAHDHTIFFISDFILHTSYLNVYLYEYCRESSVAPKFRYTLQKQVNCRTAMENQLTFIIKLLVLSALLSGLIKYILPSVPIPATATNALILVLLPTMIMAIALLWRFQNQQQT